MVTYYDKFRSTPEGLRLLLQEELILDVTELICQIMNEQNVSRKELAKRINETEDYVTWFLDGNGCFNLRDVSDVFTALGYKLKVDVEKLKE